MSGRLHMTYPAGPMSIHTLLSAPIAILVLSGCAGTADPPVRATSERTTNDTPAPAVSSPKKPSGRPYEVKGYTYGDFAAEIGVDLELISIAQYACDVYNRCNPDRKTRIIGCSEELRQEMATYCPTCQVCTQGCDLPMLLAWCEDRDCLDFNRDNDPGWDECREEMKARTCNAENEPIQCSIVQELGLTIRPRDFLRRKTDWGDELPPKRYIDIERYKHLGLKRPRRR